MKVAGPALVAVVRRGVEDFGAITPREIESQRRFLVELARLPNPFDRDASPVHVTGSGIVFGPRGTVLHLHKRLRRWLQPGGHLDNAEAPWEAAVRETMEETGLRARHPEGGELLFHLDVHAAATGHLHLDLRYLLLCDDAEPSPPPGESQDVKWLSLGDAIALADDGLVDGLKRLERWAPRESLPALPSTQDDGSRAGRARVPLCQHGQ